MFWTSILGGVGVALHWQLWLVAACTVAVQLVYQRTTDRVLARGVAHRDISALVSRKYIVIGLVLNGLMASALLDVALPAMWGSSHTLTFGQFWTDMDSVVVAGLVGGAVISIFFSGPLVGRLVPVPVQWFLQGIIIGRGLSFMSPFASGLPTELQYPGIIPSVGFLVVALLVTLILIGLGTVTAAVLRKDPSNAGRIPLPLSMTLGTIGGLLPVFMYFQYAALQSAVKGL